MKRTSNFVLRTCFCETHFAVGRCVLKLSAKGRRGVLLERRMVQQRERSHRCLILQWHITLRDDSPMRTPLVWHYTGHTAYVTKRTVARVLRCDNKPKAQSIGNVGFGHSA